MENRPEELTGGNKTPEQIQAEMQQTRESLTGKVAALETQVVGTVQTAADTFTGTVEAVKSLITTAPEAVGDTVQRSIAAVKENLNIKGLVRDNPWASLGVSAAAGFLTGFLTGGRSGSPVVAASRFAPPSPQPATPGAPGVFDELFAMLGSKVREIAETAIDSATRSVKQNVQDEVPKLIDAATANLHAAAESDLPRVPRHNGVTARTGF